MTEKEVEELYKIARATIKKNGYPYSEDLVQEMVTVGHEKMKQHYDETKSAKSTFLMMVMKQVFLVKCQQQKVFKRIPEDKILRCDKIMPDSNERITFLDTISEEENNATLKDSFFKVIEPLMKPELKLKLQGLTEEEIAKKVGYTQPCVSRRIKNNIRDIKKYLEETEQYDYYKKLLDF